ncbi:hypothetical protein BaRGS_00033722 [Batillaria attramentaria]|uniref:Uncharacterized protein n=1 Tax=Batillaria attramentaria TaxID=370345 RepID=A0ABD0JJH7_9CAEN
MSFDHFDYRLLNPDTKMLEVEQSLRDAKEILAGDEPKSLSGHPDPWPRDPSLSSLLDAVTGFEAAPSRSNLSKTFPTAAAMQLSLLIS